METNNQAPNKNNRGTIITVIVIIIVIVIIAFASPKKSKDATPNTAPTETSTDGTKTTSGITGTKTTTTTTTTPTTLSRKEALDLYQDRIIRITDQCVSEKVTETLALKKGEKVMLDNDATKAHTVVFAGTTYQIGAQGYRTASLPNDGVISRTCDPKTGTTTVIVTAK